MITTGLAFAFLTPFAVVALLAVALGVAARRGEQQLGDPLEEKWDLPACEDHEHERVL